MRLLVFCCSHAKPRPWLRMVHISCTNGECIWYNTVMYLAASLRLFLDQGEALPANGEPMIGFWTNLINKWDYSLGIFQSISEILFTCTGSRTYLLHIVCFYDPNESISNFFHLLPRFSDVLLPMGLCLRDITSDLRDLLKTFNLSSHNITFKPNMWLLLAVVLLYM